MSGCVLCQLESSLKSAIKPVPHTGVPFQPKLSHQHTVPEPFTVEGRSKVMLAQKEERIKQVLDGEKKVRSLCVCERGLCRVWVLEVFVLCVCWKYLFCVCRVYVLHVDGVCCVCVGGSCSVC